MCYSFSELYSGKSLSSHSFRFEPFFAAGAVDNSEQEFLL